MLVLIVGPSGAGKDTLINAVRAQLAGDTRVHFAKRDVTRPASEQEDNRYVSPAEFAEICNNGGYAMWWEAHGLAYGIRNTELVGADVVVCSVSRAILAEAARRFAVRVVGITASPEVLAQRLAGRGREGAVEIAERLARQVMLPEELDVVTIFNDGTVEAGAAQLRAAIVSPGR